MMDARVDQALHFKDKLGRLEEDFIKLRKGNDIFKDENVKEIGQIHRLIMKTEEALKDADSRENIVFQRAEYNSECNADQITAISAEVEASRVLMEGLIEELKHDLTRKVGVNDMHQNFTQLHDILFARFKQLEETKLATRKLIAYQKYYQPINMQQLISDNLTYLNDPGLLAHQKQLYDKVTGMVH